MSFFSHALTPQLQEDKVMQRGFSGDARMALRSGLLLISCERPHLLRNGLCYPDGEMTEQAHTSPLPLRQDQETWVLP